MNTNTIIALPIAVISSIALALTISVITTITTFAAETKKAETTKTSATAQTEAAVNYNYVAQAGDSYSKMARKAVQTYGLKYKVNLNQSRIVYAETNLTQAAGSPNLLQGQKVTIPEATVKQWVDKAKALSNEQAAQWDKYTRNVNFDTRTVGETR